MAAKHFFPMYGTDNNYICLESIALLGVDYNTYGERYDIIICLNGSSNRTSYQYNSFDDMVKVYTRLNAALRVIGVEFLDLFDMKED